MRQLFAQFIPASQPDEDWLVVGVDASNIVRPQSSTLADRGALLVHNLPECDKPITFGWQFSVLAVLPELASSWCYLLDSSRISTEKTAAQVAASQLAELAKLVAKRRLVVADRYYGSAVFVKALVTAEAKVDSLLRIKADRVFYREAPAPTGKRGAPRKDGERFKCNNEITHGPPDRTAQTLDGQGQPVEVVAWDNLHFRQERSLKLSVIRVTHQAASGKRGEPRLSWFIWVGENLLTLEKVVSTYKRRFSLQHTFRFKKQDLLWEKAHFGTPEQFELWSNLVAFVLNELVLAQPLNQAYLRPWESRVRKASPQQVRRGLATMISELGTPARPPKLPPKGYPKSPGRAKGAVVKRAERQSVVKKGATKARRRKKRE